MVMGGELQGFRVKTDVDIRMMIGLFGFPGAAV